ncbi:hypothetical protein INT45_003359 [Circinella minor]|uniref:Uncharacterized protein n=1 Tax=Circinella minor TaxID=1195481 RepID=A0A8H7S9L3_9FUNG|nr:hypothetical protein INT45_003359 [Circinella minor]
MADDDSLWQPVTHRNRQQERTEFPRWQHIRTQAEQQDIENSLCALDLQYQDEIWNDDNEDEDISSAGRKAASVEEDHEGLYLLWKERAQQKQQRQSEDEEDNESELDRALEQQKREQEYTWHWTLNWIPKYCSCCFTSSSS